MFEILTTLGTLGAVLVGGIAIYYSNRNNRILILNEKLEELFEIIYTLGKKYGVFKKLYNDVIKVREGKDENFKTLDAYYKVRDENLPKEEREKILSDLLRIEVLAKCYTAGQLKEQILKFEDLQYSFIEFITMGGSLHQELKWKDGFPSYDEFYSILEKLKNSITSEIKH